MEKGNIYEISYIKSNTSNCLSCLNINQVKGLESKSDYLNLKHQQDCQYPGNKDGKHSQPIKCILKSRQSLICSCVIKAKLQTETPEMFCRIPTPAVKTCEVLKAIKLKKKK